MKKTWLKHGLLAIAAVSVVNCGGGGGGDNGGGNDPKKPDTQTAVEEHNYDFALMSELDSSYTEDLGSGTVWDVRVVVNGEERQKLEQVVLTDVKNALSTMTFKHYDLVRTEVTAKTEDGKVLATNLKTVAYKSADLQKIWDSECAFIGEPEFEVDEAAYDYLDGEQRLVMKFDICDFAGFTLKPIMQIKPQKKNLAKKLVIYHCEFEPESVSTSSTTPYLYRYSGDTKCGYGYETLGNEQAPKIEILKEYAPGTSLYNAKILRFDDVKLGLGNAGQFKLDTDFYKPPFGSLEACHTIKLDVKYAGDNGIAVKRLVFKRSDQPGGVTWMPQGAENWPSMQKIAQYYKNASNEKVHLYRFCDWIPEAKDLQAGSVITIETN